MIENLTQPIEGRLKVIIIGQCVKHFESIFLGEAAEVGDVECVRHIIVRLVISRLKRYVAEDVASDHELGSAPDTSLCKASVVRGNLVLLESLFESVQGMIHLRGSKRGTASYELG